eukprot:gene7440-biopygen16551
MLGRTRPATNTDWTALPGILCIRRAPAAPSGLQWTPRMPPAGRVGTGLFGARVMAWDVMAWHATCFSFLSLTMLPKHTHAHFARVAKVNAVFTRIAALIMPPPPAVQSQPRASRLRGDPLEGQCPSRSAAGATPAGATASDGGCAGTVCAGGASSPSVAAATNGGAEGAERAWGGGGGEGGGAASVVMLLPTPHTPGIGGR